MPQNWLKATMLTDLHCGCSAVCRIDGETAETACEGIGSAGYAAGQRVYVARVHPRGAGWAIAMDIACESDV